MSKKLTLVQIKDRLKGILPKNVKVIGFDKNNMPGRTHLLTRDKYGICSIYYLNLIRGAIPTAESAIDKTQYFINKSKSIHGNKYGYEFSEYKKATLKVKIMCKEHGAFYQTPSHHINNKSGCPKCSGREGKDTDQFIKQANVVHKNKYNYSLVKYKNAHSKIIIICDVHGEFNTQTAGSHLSGCGCPLCGRDTINEYHRKNPIGWTHTNWIKTAAKSKRFDNFKVYILECWNNEERFYKIGKTFLQTKMRYGGKFSMPYNWKVIKEVIGSGRKICKLEKKLKDNNKDFSYLPKIHFGGKYECFSELKMAI